MSSMESILTAAMDGHRQAMHEAKTSILPEAAIMTLQEFAERYTAPMRFKVGDIVTPVSGSNTNGEGKPNIVVEVFTDPIRIFSTANAFDVFSNCFGVRLDMRVISMSQGPALAHCAESWKFVAYEAKP